MKDRPEQIIRGESGTQTHFGYEVAMYADRCETVLQLEERFSNRNGMMHGGVLALLLDTTCGYAASRALSEDGRQPLVTVSMTTNFIAPADTPSVRVIGRVTRAGKSLVHAQGEAHAQDGTLLATASAVFKAIRTPLDRPTA